MKEVKISASQHTLEVSLSLQKYECKPAKSQISKISWKPSTITINELANGLKQGQTICPICLTDANGMITAKCRKNANFVKTYYIGIDVDNEIRSMQDFVSTLNYQPTIAYTTCNNGIKGYRYRLLYIFDEPITNANAVSMYYDELLKEVGIVDMQDNCGNDSVRIFYGNGSGCDMIVNDVVYELSSLNVDMTSLPTTSTIDYVVDTNDTKQFYTDWASMLRSDFIVKYQYAYNFNMSAPLDYVDGVAEIKDGTHKLQFRWHKVDGQTQILKFKQGERNNTLYKQGMVIKEFNPGISLEGLCYALTSLVYQYYDNTDGELTNKNIKTKAMKIMQAEECTVDCYDKRKFAVDSTYFAQMGMNSRQAVGYVRRNQTDYKIGCMYDSTKTDKENVKAMQEQGINISIRRLQEFKKGQGIYKNTKQEQALELILRGVKDTEIMDIVGMSKRSLQRVKASLKQSMSITNNEDFSVEELQPNEQKVEYTITTTDDTIKEEMTITTSEEYYTPEQVKQMNMQPQRSNWCNGIFNSHYKFFN